MKADILDRKWKYVPALKTSVADTFARVRAEQQQASTETAKVVSAIKPRVKGRAP